MSSPLSIAVDQALSAHEAAPAHRAAAHLADAAFRFGPPAPAEAPARPAADLPGAAWTLDQTLREIRLRGAEVTLGTGGLKVRHAHRLPRLVAAIQAHREAVRLWLALGRPAPSRGWDDATALRLEWMREHLGVPAGPLALRPGETVADGARFVASVEGRYAEGPEAPCAAGLRRDLADLFARHARLDVPAPVRVPARVPAPARAA